MKWTKGEIDQNGQWENAENGVDMVGVRRPLAADAHSPALYEDEEGTGDEDEDRRMTRIGRGLHLCWLLLLLLLLRERVRE